MKGNTFFIQLKHDLWDERLKFVLLFFLFMFQVVMSIVSIFYMAELFALFGLDFVNPIPPTGEAVFRDFFGDQLLFGIVIMALGAMSIFASPIEDGSISFSLARPISRSEYALARILSRIMALITPFFIASFIGWIYMGMFFDVLPLEKLIFSFIPLGLLFIYLGVITSAFSTRTSALTAGLLAIGIFIVQFTISAFAPLELLSPFTPANVWIEILGSSNIQWDQQSFNYLMKTGLLGGWILIPLVCGIYSLNKRDL